MKTFPIPLPNFFFSIYLCLPTGKGLKKTKLAALRKFYSSAKYLFLIV